MVGLAVYHPPPRLSRRGAPVSDKISGSRLKFVIIGGFIVKVTAGIIIGVSVLVEIATYHHMKV